MKKELGIIYLVAFATNQDQNDFACQQAVEFLAKKKAIKETEKGKGEYRITPKFEKKLEKWFGIKFKEE